MKANKTRKNKKQSGGFQFLTDMFNKGKDGWNKSKQSLSQTSKNMFSPKPKPVATTTATTTPTTMPVQEPMPMPAPMPVNNETGVPVDVPPYSDPMVPTSITTGGRKKKRRKSQKKRLSKKKRYSRKKRGGYNLNDSAPVSGLKVASPTYWIGGKKSKRRRRKSRR